MSAKRSKNSSVLDDSDSYSELSFHSFSNSEIQDSEDSDDSDTEVLFFLKSIVFFFN